MIDHLRVVLNQDLTELKAAGIKQNVIIETDSTLNTDTLKINICTSPKASSELILSASTKVKGLYAGIKKDDTSEVKGLYAGTKKDDTSAQTSLITIDEPVVSGRAFAFIIKTTITKFVL
jgi:hypothetical protein